MPRDYKKEYKTYQGTAEQKKNRATRNKVRRQAIRDGKAKVGDGTSVEHVKPLSKGGTNSKSNLKIVSRSDNASFDRNSDKSVRRNTPGIYRKKKTK
jgi:hypothetical protein